MAKEMVRNDERVEKVLQYSLSAPPISILRATVDLYCGAFKWLEFAEPSHKIALYHTFSPWFNRGLTVVSLISLCVLLWSTVSALWFTVHPHGDLLAGSTVYSEQPCVLLCILWFTVWSLYCIWSRLCCSVWVHHCTVYTVSHCQWSQLCDHCDSALERGLLIYFRCDWGGAVIQKT